MKRITSALMMIILLIGNTIAYGVEISEVTENMPKCGKNINWELNDGVLELHGTGDMYDYDTENPPWYGKNIRRVEIAEGIEKIGRFAFSECRNLTEVKLPSSLKVIEIGSFHNCTVLKSIDIPPLVTGIKSLVFKNCFELEQVNINGQVTEIADCAFQNCLQLSSVSMTNVKSIGNMAFFGCTNLSEIIIPKGMESIGPKAFGVLDGNSFRKVIFEGGCPSVADDAFENVTAEVYYPEGRWTDFPSWGGTLIWKTKHSMKYVAEKPASCTETGRREYWICENPTCTGRLFIDPNGLQETDNASLVIAALGHEWKELAYDPCTDTQIDCECIRCGQIKSEQRKAGHADLSYEQQIIEIPQSFYDSGICNEIVYCGVCRREISREQKPLFYSAELSKDLYTYDGTEKKPEITVKLGEKEVESYLYDVGYTDNINAGRAYVTITGMGGAIFKGSAKFEFIIKRKPLTDENPRLNRYEYVYSGKYKTPTVWIDGLKNDVDYTVKYKSNKSVGKAYASVSGKGNYIGELKPIEFTIIPNSIKISRISTKRKDMSVSWSINTAQTDGYQISYALNKDFSNEVKKSVADRKTGKANIKGLKSGKRYYVRIRAYKTADSKRYYSHWSSASSIKVK